jgi:hypothetical protein
VDRRPQTEADNHHGQEELARLLKRAEQGDRGVLPELRQALDGDANLWRYYGDLALHAEASLIRLAAGTNLLLAESLQRKLHAMKNELATESASPLERLLVERVTATWLQAAYCDAVAAQAGPSSEARSKMIQWQQDGAHRRHLTALKTLATVRKLLRPAPSPVEIASRLDRSGQAVRCDRMAIAGTVPVKN